MGKYEIAFATVRNEFKEKWGNQNDDLQAFQLVSQSGNVSRTLSFGPAGLYIDAPKEPPKLKSYQPLLRVLIDWDKYGEIRTAGVGLPTKLKELGLGWDGNDRVFWSVFWQRCINEKVLKLKDFEESARDRYKLKELQSDVTLADELKNAMKAMKNKSKGTQSVTASGAKATEGTAPRDSERPVSRRGTTQDSGAKSSHRANEHSRTRGESKKNWSLPSLGSKKKGKKQEDH